MILTQFNKRYTISISGNLLLLFALLLVMLPGCSNEKEKTIQNVYADSLYEHNNLEKYDGVKSTPDSALAINEIPVLCYHQVRDWKPTDSKNDRVFIMPVEKFKGQIQLLHDQGYHYILPGQLVAYLKNKEELPSKPIMLTFDDATASQYMNALPELDKYGFKGVFFIMTVVLNHPFYMSRDEVKILAKEGHVIGCHTWNHEDVVLYKDDDWQIQVEKPVKELETITGMPVKYFAYPYGLWNNNAIEHLKKYGFVAAFRLWGKYDVQEPLYTIRRILVDGNWSSAQLLKAIKKDTAKIAAAYMETCMDRN